MNLNTDDYHLLCEATCRVFGYALRKRFESIRSKHPNSFVGLNTVEADKTLRLLDKVWAKRDPSSRNSRLFNFPVGDVNDKHGRRIAFASASDKITDPLSSDVKVSSVLDTMITLDNLSTPASRTLQIHEEEYEWGTVQLIEPQVTGSDLNRLAQDRFLSPEDHRFLDDFCEVCGELEEREITAIGRHETPDKTRESLLYEFRRWIAWTKECLDLLREPSILTNESAKERLAYCIWQCWSFARQCILKSREERRWYENGYEKILSRAQSNPGVLIPFQAAQKTAADIWDNYQVHTLVFPSYYCWEFAIYQAGTISGIDAFKSVVKRPDISDSETREAFVKLNFFNSIDPASRPYTFSPDTVNWANHGTRSPEILIPPPEMWSGSESVSTFADRLGAVFNHITASYLEPDLISWRGTGA